jgi:hypothetical protein
LKNEANVIPAEEPLSKELMGKTLKPDFTATSFECNPRHGSQSLASRVIAGIKKPGNYTG